MAEHWNPRCATASTHARYLRLTRRAIPRRLRILRIRASSITTLGSAPGLRPRDRYGSPWCKGTAASSEQSHNLAVCSLSGKPTARGIVCVADHRMRTDQSLASKDDITSDDRRDFRYLSNIWWYATEERMKLASDLLEPWNQEVLIESWGKGITACRPYG